MRYFGPLV